MNKLQGWMVALFSVLAVTVASCGGATECRDGCNCGGTCRACPCPQPEPLTEVDAATR